MCLPRYVLDYPPAELEMPFSHREDVATPSSILALRRQKLYLAEHTGYVHNDVLVRGIADPVSSAAPWKADNCRFHGLLLAKRRVCDLSRRFGQDMILLAQAQG